MSDDLNSLRQRGIPFVAIVDAYGVPIGGSSVAITNWPASQAVTISGTVPVSGTFWQATQPISAAALPLPFGASTETTLAAIKAKTDNLDVLLSTRTKPADVQHVTIDNASVAVTGTFWQSTQPVSIAAMPSTPVTGTFWPATQPVSLAANTPDVTDRAARLLGHVTVDNASLAVTGTFFQATQPVSIASMPSTPVTGTFWQATQPVSGPITDVQLRASAIPVTNLWPYPVTVTPVAQQSANLAATQGTATLAAAANKFTYLSDVQIFGVGATASSKITATITGLLGGAMTIPISVPAGVTLNLTPIILHFDPPFRSSAVNTAIVVTLPSLGSGSTHATVSAQGFQQ